MPLSTYQELRHVNPKRASYHNSAINAVKVASGTTVSTLETLKLNLIDKRDFFEIVFFAENHEPNQFMFAFFQKEWYFDTFGNDDFKNA